MTPAERAVIDAAREVHTKPARPRRTRRLQIRLSDDEWASLVQGATDAETDDVSTWVRNVALLAVRTRATLPASLGMDLARIADRLGETRDAVRRVLGRYPDG